MQRGGLKPRAMRLKPRFKLKPKLKKRKTKVALFREWGVPDNAYKRYGGLKGVYWYYFSQMVRQRDIKAHGGKCMTCGVVILNWRDGQAGHLFAAKDCGFALLFHPFNIFLQHPKCNNPRFTPSAGIYNTRTFIARFGEAKLEELLLLKGQKTKEWSKAEYERQIRLLPTYVGVPRVP